MEGLHYVGVGQERALILDFYRLGVNEEASSVQGEREGDNRGFSLF